MFNVIHWWLWFRWGSCDLWWQTLGLKLAAQLMKQLLTEWNWCLLTYSTIQNCAESLFFKSSVSSLTKGDQWYMWCCSLIIKAVLQSINSIFSCRFLWLGFLTSVLPSHLLNTNSSCLPLQFSTGSHWSTRHFTPSQIPRSLFTDV